MDAEKTQVLKTVCLCLHTQMQQQFCLLFNHFSEKTLIFSTLFNERKTVNRVENYFEITIPHDEPDGFRLFSTHKATFDDLAKKISKCNEYKINILTCNIGESAIRMLK